MTVGVLFCLFNSENLTFIGAPRPTLNLLPSWSAFFSGKLGMNCFGSKAKNDCYVDLVLLFIALSLYAVYSLILRDEFLDSPVVFQSLLVVKEL